MGNVPDQTVICKCLNSLPVADEDFPLFNYRRKFTLAKAVKLLIAAQLNQHNNLEEIHHHLRATPALQEAIGLSSISASQIVRTLGQLPLDELQALWIKLHQRIQQAYPPQSIAGLGKLRILDSTVLSLPEVAGKWAYCSRTSNGVKIHTSLVIASSEVMYPNQMICSTRGVADSEVALELIVDPEAIHVIDRGYIVYHHYKHWVDHRIRFVARIQKN